MYKKDEALHKVWAVSVLGGDNISPSNILLDLIFTADKVLCARYIFQQMVFVDIVKAL